MCEITSGYDKLCDTQGGVATVYAWNTNQVDTATVVSGSITALTFDAGGYIYQFNVEMETATFTDAAIGERANGAYARQHDATVVLFGNTPEMITQLELMGKGRTTWAFELNDGTYEVLFLENGAKVSDSRTPGTAFEDMNGNTLTLTGKEKSKAPKISSSLIAANLAPAS
jgi:hypothetical protein